MFGLLRIAASDTSNPNQKLPPGTNCIILHKPSVRLWMDSDSTGTDRGNGVACDVGDGRMTGPPDKG